MLTPRPPLPCLRCRSMRTFCVVDSSQPTWSPWRAREWTMSRGSLGLQTDSVKQRSRLYVTNGCSNINGDTRPWELSQTWLSDLLIIKATGQHDLDQCQLDNLWTWSVICVFISTVSILYHIQALAFGYCDSYTV